MRGWHSSCFVKSKMGTAVQQYSWLRFASSTVVQIVLLQHKPAQPLTPYTFPSILSPLLSCLNVTLVPPTHELNIPPSAHLPIHETQASQLKALSYKVALSSQQQQQQQQLIAASVSYRRMPPANHAPGAQVHHLRPRDALGELDSYMYSPTMYTDHNSLAALGLANQIMRQLVIPGA